MTKEQIDSFWARVDVRSKDECWNWTKGKHGPGYKAYGIVWFGGNKHKCHRLALQLSKGHQEGKLACHTCDNPTCCNPGHLYWGTNLDNARDCVSRGRKNAEKGSKRYCAVLTEQDVADLKAMAPFRTYGWGAFMANKYKVGRTAIGNAISGFRWKHIKPSEIVPELPSLPPRRGYKKALQLGIIQQP